MAENLAMMQGILNILFPRRCVMCHKEGGWLCIECGEVVKKNTQYQSIQLDDLEIVSLFNFSEPAVRELIHTLKYNGIYEAATVLQVLASACYQKEALQEIIGKVVLVPVPTSPLKRKLRGYNQAEEIAQRLGEWLGLRLESNLLFRTNKQKSQVGKTAEERSMQVQESFYCKKEIAEKLNQPIMLVDDVFTTGSTLQACTQVLMRNGLRGVRGLVIAHGQ